MVWLTLDILLMFILMVMYLSLKHSDKESHITELIFEICLVGFAFFSVLGFLQTEKQLKF